MKRRNFLKLLLGACGVGVVATKAKVFAGFDPAVPGAERTVRSIKFPSPLSKLEVQPDGKTLLVLTEDGCEYFLDGQTGKYARVWEDPPNSGIYWGYNPEPLRFEYDQHAHAFKAWSSPAQSLSNPAWMTPKTYRGVVDAMKEMLAAPWQ